MSSPSFPEPPTAIPATSLEEVDRRVARLAERKDAWLKVGLIQRIGYLKKCLQGTLDIAEKWVEDGCKLKGLSAADTLAGEEWLAGPMATVRNIRLLIKALEAGGQPTPPALHVRPDGQAVARVFPTNLQDKLMFTGFSAEVWIEPGKSPTQGQIYREPPAGPGKVCLILGAGNVSSIPPMDALYKLFVENEVVVLKMNPVNEHVGPKLEQAFRSLVDDGFFTVVYGGAKVGAHLADHPKVDTLHVTGSDRTYDAIVWGGDAEEQKQRKQKGDKKNKRPFTAELGCVTPVMVVPGDWSDSEIDYQAQNVASMIAHNASFNCNAAKVLVTARDWPLRDAFVSRVRSKLAATPPRKAYYPGAKDRHRRFLDQYPKALVVGEEREGAVPWTVLPDVQPRSGEYALTNEAFCGVLAEVDLDAKNAAEYLPKAVAFANDTMWGTLSCMMLIDKRTEREHSGLYESAIEELRYGSIAVNAWAGMCYALVSTPWGAFPGHPPEDIQSGTGFVHNSYLFDHPEKAIVKAPFVMRPKPLYFANHKMLAPLARKLLKLEASYGFGRLPSIVVSALRG
jgi:acyl-CoA reductase-like NAD-dependent aldehyde dehydrogenase